MLASDHLVLTSRSSWTMQQAYEEENSLEPIFPPFYSMQGDADEQIDGTNISRETATLSQEELIRRRARQRQYDKLRKQKEAEAFKELQAMLPKGARQSTKLDILRSTIDLIKNLKMEAERNQNASSPFHYNGYYGGQFQNSNGLSTNDPPYSDYIQDPFGSYYCP
ncbi:hypothetical protein Aperf_G00000120051 [Anoplocephala perfoliata]